MVHKRERYATRTINFGREGDFTRIILEEIESDPRSSNKLSEIIREMIMQGYKPTKENRVTYLRSKLQILKKEVATRTEEISKICQELDTLGVNIEELLWGAATEEQKRCQTPPEKQ